ncbi:MAG TPA: tetratricopeptide repeat protein [Candidatus Eisenbacteria bacterium]
MSAFDLLGRLPAPDSRRLSPDPDDIRAARRLHDLARQERDQGRFDRAEALAMQALRMLEVHASTSHPEVAAVLSTLVVIGQRRRETTAP